MARTSTKRQPPEATRGGKKTPLVTFRIPADEYESLLHVAKRSGQSMSEIVRNAVTSQLRGPLEGIEVMSGGAEMTVDSPEGTTQSRTRGVVPRTSPPKTTGDIDIQVTE